MKNILQSRDPGQINALAFGWSADYPDPHNFVYPLMHSDVSLYSWGYNNPDVDGLIEAGLATLDPAERQAIYYELQK